MDKRKNSLRPIAMFESIRISPKATLKVRNNPIVDPNKQTKIIEMQDPSNRRWSNPKQLVEVDDLLHWLVPCGCVQWFHWNQPPSLCQSQLTELEVHIDWQWIAFNQWSWNYKVSKSLRGEEEEQDQNNNDFRKRGTAVQEKCHRSWRRLLSYQACYRQTT